MTESSETTAVLLLNLGGPDSLAAVQPFLYNLFSDPEIIRLPLGFLLQKPLARVIANRRSITTRQYYAEIGGKSPIRRLTAAQGGALVSRLTERTGQPWRLFVAMRYWNPSTEQAIDDLTRQGIRRVVVLTLYPQYSLATTGSSLNELGRVLADRPGQVETTTIDRWYDQPRYLDALARLLTSSLAQVAAERRDDVDVIFSAHSLPQSYIDAGDPYVEHTQATIAGVLARMGTQGQRLRWHLAYQSRSGPVKWLTPSTDDVIIELGKAGRRDLMVVPISFVSDHIETLHELDIRYRALAVQHGIRGFHRVPSLNTDPGFIEGLADLVIARAQDRWGLAPAPSEEPAATVKAQGAVQPA